MQPRELFSGTEISTRGVEEIVITGLASDSRAVAPGYLFAALDGVQHQGSLFVADAIARGAAAILSARPVDQSSVPVLVHDNPRRALALCARNFFTTAPRYIAAVTGTNGKTSVANFLRHLWQAADRSAASIGTLGVQHDQRSVPLTHTTPDPIVLHSHMRDLYAEGVTHCVIEASSHGLDQCRLDGLHIQLAGFTNLTHDHLDYHETEEAYFNAKARLFTHLLDGPAVIFVDHPMGQRLARDVQDRGGRLISVGTQNADFIIRQTARAPSGQSIMMQYAGEIRQVDVPLIGDFQVENIGVAAAMAVISGLSLAELALDDLPPPPGRMQLAGTTSSGAHVYIDYAHTPDALLRVLQTARAHSAADVHVVFGCGGNRDQAKRPEMGAIADQWADHIVITDDNPRHEDAASIRAMIRAACPSAVEIPDRRDAIHSALGRAQAHDMIVIAGKGHETGQMIADTVLPFSDLDEVRAALATGVAHG